MVLSIHTIKDHMSNYDEIYSNLHDTGNSVTSSIFLLEGREKENEYWLKAPMSLYLAAAR